MLQYIQLNIHTKCRPHRTGAVGEKGIGWESHAVYSRCMHQSFYVRRRKPVIGKLRRQGMKTQSICFIRCKSEDLLWCRFQTFGNGSFCAQKQLFFACWFVIYTEKLCCDNFGNYHGFFIINFYGFLLTETEIMCIIFYVEFILANLSKGRDAKLRV